MLTEPERPRGTWSGLGILAVGIAIGALARPARWMDRSVPAASPAPFPALVPAVPGETPRANELETIELVIPPESAAALERLRARALDQGIITQPDDGSETVPAEFVHAGTRLKADIRLKGDWTDHVDSERWSYRVHLHGGTFLGMVEFSIQSPKTRGYLWEWLVHEAARREGVLVPRSTFLNVVQNGHAMGVYFLEEHFEKQLLESQGRREGPIVVWDESVLWSTLLEEGEIPSKDRRGLDSELRTRGHTLEPAEVRAYGEKHLAASENLNRALHAALDQMKALRALALVAQPETDRRRVLQAMDELRGRTLEELVDVDRLGCAHALLSMFQVEHSLAWHNMRFYRDPVQARLEPILFDNSAQEPSAPDPVPFRARDLCAAFARSPGYVQALFEHLGRMLRSDWLDGLFARVDPELARYEAALLAEGPLPPGCSTGEMKQRLRAEQVYLRRVCLPEDPINFEASYTLTDADHDAGRGWIEVRAWATTRAPVLVEGFRFSNGGFTGAAGTLEAGSGASARGSAIVLPADGREVVFRFPMDERLANLETVEKVTRALRQAMEADGKLDLDVDAVYRLLSAQDARSERLTVRRAVPATEAGDRPVAPTLEQALERHPFLRYDFARSELLTLPGTWEVDGDLVLPARQTLVIAPGTTLRFREGAALVTDGPLQCPGTTRAPIVLEPVEGAPRWSGIAVLGAGARCEWSDVVVRGTTALERGGWILTGGVSFYRTPVTLRRCRFEDTQAEDGLNVFGADILLDQVTFTGSHSDSFDGDFVTGSLENCVFQDGLADGIDVSGSDVSVRDCRFERLGDKALSIGERSKARISGGTAVDVGIGVASKDASEAEVSGLSIEARQYALAAFVKKPEYGPARLIARQLTIRSAGRGNAIAQTGCVLELDGVVVPTEPIDVDRSYEEGILGHAK